MLTDHLFDSVLMEPAKAGADHLFVISGYATAAMAYHHLHALLSSRTNVKVSLIVGMCPQDGLSLSNHKAFRQVMSSEFPRNFECSYVMRAPAVHSKAYLWLRGKSPVSGFLGSANYTQNAFGGSQREAMTGCDPKAGIEYFQSLAKQSIYCTHSEVEDCILIYSDAEYKRRRKKRVVGDAGKTTQEDYKGLPSVKVNLLDKKDGLPQRSGLNWGQRPELGREPNQAYIRLPSSVTKTDFFPERAVHFTLLTDDGKVLICTRAQDKGKAIETPENNSRIGKYFRDRLGVASGHLVTKDDLVKYGRSDLDFYKLDDETYYMDFSPKH